MPDRICIEPGSDAVRIGRRFTVVELGSFAFSRRFAHQTKEDDSIFERLEVAAFASFDETHLEFDRLPDARFDVLDRWVWLHG